MRMRHSGTTNGMVRAAGERPLGTPRRGRPATRNGTAAGVQSVERALAILDTLAASGTALSLTDLSRLAGTPPGRTHRYLVSLVRAGMVMQSAATGLYDLGPAARRIGVQAFNRFDGLLLAHERLARLRALTGQTLVLYVWSEAGPTVIRWEPGHHPLPLSLRVGSTLPLTSSATGRVFLAHLPAAITGAALRQARALERADGIRPIPVRELKRELARIRQLGYAAMADNIFAGVDSIAVPVFDVHGDIVCVITALSQRRHLNERVRARLREQLCATARQLSADLGHAAATEQGRSAGRAPRLPPAFNPRNRTTAGRRST